MKKTLFFILCMLSFPYNCVAEATISRGIEYYLAGRMDLAESEFQSLLKEDLSKEEKAVVLYNLATTYLSENFLNEATQYFNEIQMDAISSPEIRASIAKNKAICALKFAERYIKFGPQGASLDTFSAEITGYI